MDIPVLKVKDLQWKISMRQGYLKLMVRWLLFSVFMMVCCCPYGFFFSYSRVSFHVIFLKVYNYWGGSVSVLPSFLWVLKGLFSRV